MLGILRILREQRIHGYPAQLGDFIGVWPGDPCLRVGGTLEHMNMFMLGQPATNIGAIGDLTNGLKGQGDSQLLLHAPVGAIGDIFLPMWVAAASVRPQPAAMVFAISTPLNEQLAFRTEHKGRDGQVQNAQFVRSKLLDGVKRAILGDGRNGDL